MVIPGIRALTLLRSLPPLLLALAFPAAADIDTSILRSQSKGGGAPKSAAAAPAAAGQPAATSEESPNDWYQRAVAFDRPGAGGNDLASAAYWYQKAAEKGHSDAQTNLAVMYAEGRGVDFNSLESARWYRKAAEAGNVRAQYSLAIMYHLGQGVTRDYDDAIHWYESAARQGDANAMNNLAFMHGMGEGVVQSNVEAYVWFSLAASRGNADAAENRDLAAAEMTPEERRKARQRYTQLEEQLGL
jgi:TPR repeat protein